ncbi:hypothetical protein V1L54_03130 [Streptomyces sp. TRM 70361]|uniref:hypothetical protein n=1 Tax=Streptomyces sp. TRM 70361 TaxID=3116553 RepID=UPI002E7B8167|nr:hypothetical protein [Streptomyces sp. TRM 70361]MEE1938415.1 hypothetical protein [Streptomyces sp. TRM 70361]
MSGAVGSVVEGARWLAGCGRAWEVLGAWARGGLAEVPAGGGFDVVRVPVGLGPETVRWLRVAGVPLGPVLVGPDGADFVVAEGTAEGDAVLPPGTPVLLPPACVVEPYRLGGRGWLVGPAGREPARGGDVASAYALALAEAGEVLR